MEGWTVMLLSLLLLFITYHTEGKPMRRENVVIGKISIIRNETFACKTLLKRGMRKIKLSDASKMRIFQIEGGIYMPSYMARTSDEANRNFRDMLTAAAPRKTQVPSFRRVEDNLNSRNKVQEKLNSFFKTLPRSGRSISESDASGPSSETAVSERRRITEETPSRRSKRGTTERERIDYCMERGALENGHKRMCRTCAATRILTDDSFPRIYNEAVCNQDMGCFYVANIAHGQCRQSYININILHRTEGTCSMALLDGTHVIVDDWRLVTLSLRTGCECFIDNNSMFAVFV